MLVSLFFFMLSLQKDHFDQLANEEFAMLLFIMLQTLLIVQPWTTYDKIYLPLLVIM